MQHILSVSRVGGRKYVVARGEKYVFLRIDDSKAVESIEGFGETGLYYDEVSALVPLGVDARFCMLGLGGGTCARRYRELGGQGIITAIEIDTEVIRLAYQFFRLGEWDVNVVPVGAVRFIQEASATGLLYDVVFDDLYTSGRNRVVVDGRILVKPGGFYVRNEERGELIIERIE